MKNKYYFYVLAALLLLLAGCGSVSTPPSQTATAPEAMPQGEVMPGVIPEEAGAAIPVEPEPKPVMSGNRAVIALLDRAQTDNEAGRRETAGTSLERAIRIEPRNPWLWHELAQLRLTQGQYIPAISLARKSNSFAGRERRLQAMNWRLIGNARVAQGDSDGAEQAFKRATELELEK